MREVGRSASGLTLPFVLYVRFKKRNGNFLLMGTVHVLRWVSNGPNAAAASDEAVQQATLPPLEKPTLSKHLAFGPSHWLISS